MLRKRITLNFFFVNLNGVKMYKFKLSSRMKIFLSNPLTMLQRSFPLLQWVPYYNTETGISDLVAGITIGLTLIPQVIAYAALAGLSPEVSPSRHSKYFLFLMCKYHKLCNLRYQNCFHMSPHVALLCLYLPVLKSNSMSFCCYKRFQFR